MAESKEATHYRFYRAFHKWFSAEGGCDFWSECDAPDRLAMIAVEISDQYAADALADEKMEHNLLKELLSRPEIDDFWEGIVLEAAHQRQRWGDAHDRDKSAEDWFWLIGYLSGKALRAAIEGDKAKAKHHTISAAAALFQWHQAIKADGTDRGLGKDEDIDPDGGRLGMEPGKQTANRL